MTADAIQQWDEERRAILADMERDIARSVRKAFRRLDALRLPQSGEPPRRHTRTPAR